MFNAMPTDNLYKFLCGIGLVLLTASITISPYLLKATAETMQIAEDMKSVPIRKDTRGGGRPYKILVGTDVIRLERSTDEYNLILELAHSQITDMRLFTCLGSLFGTVMFFAGLGFWLFRTQLPSDRSASLAGTTRIILDEKHQLVLDLGPILREALQATRAKTGTELGASAAYILVHHLPRMQEFRDRYGSVIPKKAVDLLEQTIHTTDLMSRDWSHFEFPLSSDNEGPESDSDREPTEVDILDAHYEKQQQAQDRQQRESNRRRAYLEQTVRGCTILKDVADLYTIIENDVRRFVSLTLAENLIGRTCSCAR